MTKKILIVDDDAATRASFRAIIEGDKGSQPVQVLEAGTGSDCLRTFDRDGPFSLILLDVSLPDLDGYEICRALRRVDPRVPIVFVTARDNLKDFNAGRAAGGDSYLVKPISRQALKSAVSLFINLERAAPTST
jgi:CheY-like chemotaxis protein